MSKPVQAQRETPVIHLAEFLRQLIEQIVDAAVSAKLNAPQQEAFLSAKQVALALGVSPTTIEGWRSHGCPSHKVGGARRYLLSEINQWSQERRARKPSEPTTLEHVGVRLISKVGR